MKLEHFLPTYRNVLLFEHKRDKTEKGIYLASSDLPSEERVFKVVKAGPDCTIAKPEQAAIVLDGIRLQDIKLSVDGESRLFHIVMEQQIVGVAHNYDSISNAPGSQSKTSGSIKSETQ